MAHAMNEFGVVGASIAVVKDGKVLINKGYGVKSLETKQPVDEHTQFAIASNSKAFTTMALAMLVEEGKLKWTDKVKTYIPEFTMYDPYVAENFNIQDLLTHRSGLGLGMGDLMFFPDGTQFTLDDLLASFQHFKPVSAFRTKWDYDNLLYIVAGEVVRRVSGKSWEQFIEEDIFTPLYMDHSYASLSGIKDTENLSSAFSAESGKPVQIPNFEDMINGAAGGIYSNVDDMKNWVLMLLSKGKYGENLSKSLVPGSTFRELWKIHTVMDVNNEPRYNSHFAGYGLGWFLTDVKGNMKVEHTGGLPGMLSKVMMVPDQNLGVIVLTNTSNEGAGLFSAMCNSILDSYLGLEPMDWISTYATYLKMNQGKADEVTKKVWDQVKSNQKVKIDKSQYLGTYKDVWFGNMEVFDNQGQLWIKSLKSPKLNGPLKFYQANTFAVSWEYQDMNADAFVMFQLDETGKAIGMTLKGISPNIDFSFDFQDLDLKRITD